MLAPKHFPEEVSEASTGRINVLFKGSLWSYKSASTIGPMGPIYIQAFPVNRFRKFRTKVIKNLSTTITINQQKVINNCVYCFLCFNDVCMEILAYKIFGR